MFEALSEVHLQIILASEAPKNWHYTFYYKVYLCPVKIGPIFKPSQKSTGFWCTYNWILILDRVEVPNKIGTIFKPLSEEQLFKMHSKWILLLDILLKSRPSKNRSNISMKYPIMILNEHKEPDYSSEEQPHLLCNDILNYIHLHVIIYKKFQSSKQNSLILFLSKCAEYINISDNHDCIFYI